MTTNAAIGYCGATSTRFDERSWAVPDLEQYRSPVERTSTSTKICSASCGFTGICTAGSTHWIQVGGLQPFLGDDGTDKKKCYIFYISGLHYFRPVFSVLSISIIFVVEYDTHIRTWAPLSRLNFWQFQPVLVKQDQDKTENPKSGKRNARTQANTNPDPVGTVEPSASA